MPGFTCLNLCLATGRLQITFTFSFSAVNLCLPGSDLLSKNETNTWPGLQTAEAAGIEQAKLQEPNVIHVPVRQSIKRPGHFAITSSVLVSKEVGGAWRIESFGTCIQ